jgi:hypothetical protein
MRRDMQLVVMAMCAVLLAACARAYPPPGGERDRLPPALVTTTPGPLEVVPGFAGPVVFRFDERLSERGFSESLVTVSPLDGALRVRRAGNEVRVEIDGGWRPNRIYRVVLLPGLRDLFGNERNESAEIVFSTGPPVPNTAIAGIVHDRLTERPARDAVISAVQRGEEVAYSAVGDSAGFFSLRHVPIGEYDVVAFADQNRNRRRDPAEPVDRAVASVTADGDTVMLVFHVLAPDTTPPRVTGAELVDSMHVRIVFDDHFDPSVLLDGAEVELHALPDSVPFARARRVVVATVHQAEQRAVTRAPEPTPADTVGVPAPPPPPPQRVVTPQAAPLPARELVAQLDRALAPGTYAVVVRGVVNISGLAGGGHARLQVAAPQPPAGPPADDPPADEAPAP